jgi:hypothetical protein
VTEFSAGAGSLAIDSPLREGQSGTIAIDAPADATAWLLFAPTAAYTPLFARQGVLAPSPTALFLVPIGGTGPTGSLSLPFAAPQLPSGVDGLVVPFQLALSTAAGTTLDGASLLVVVDATIP